MDDTSRVAAYLHRVMVEDEEMAELVEDRVFDGISPTPRIPPMVVFQQQTPLRSVSTGVGRYKVMATGLYVIRGIVQGASFTPAVPIADRISELFDKVVAGVQDGITLDMAREEDFKMLDVDEGVQYRHLGGMFRVWAYET